MSNIGVISDFTASDASVRAQYELDWKYRLYEAFLVYNDSSLPTSRQTWWPNMRGKLTGIVSGNTVTLIDPTDGLRATDIWIFHQIALGDRIVDRTYPITLTDAARTAALEHLESAIKTLGRTWYGVVTSAAKSTELTQWATASIADGSAIYSDLISNTGAVRSPDASFGLPGGNIATGFKPDTPTLR